MSAIVQTFLKCVANFLTIFKNAAESSLQYFFKIEELLPEFAVISAKSREFRLIRSKKVSRRSSENQQQINQF